MMIPNSNIVKAREHSKIKITLICIGIVQIIALVTMYFVCGDIINLLCNKTGSTFLYFAITMCAGTVLAIDVIMIKKVSSQPVITSSGGFLEFIVCLLVMSDAIVLKNIANTLSGM